MERTNLIKCGISMTVFMVALEILGGLGFHYNSETAIILYYVSVSIVLASSMVFTIYHARMQCRESVIV